MSLQGFISIETCQFEGNSGIWIWKSVVGQSSITIVKIMIAWSQLMLNETMNRIPHDNYSTFYFSLALICLFPSIWRLHDTRWAPKVWILNNFSLPFCFQFATRLRDTFLFWMQTCKSLNWRQRIGEISFVYQDVVFQCVFFCFWIIFIISWSFCYQCTRTFLPQFKTSMARFSVFFFCPNSECVNAVAVFLLRDGA